MGEAEVEQVRELLGDDAGHREFGNAFPGSRHWRAVARRILGERYPFDERKEGANRATCRSWSSRRAGRSSPASPCCTQ